MASEKVIIVGGGHNGLITAFYLAKAGFKPLVLERREVLGGAAITEEFYPGFRCPTLAHASSIRPDIARDMHLEKHGLRMIAPDAVLTALSLDGRALTLYADLAKTQAEIAKFSQKDSEKYAEFLHSMAKMGAVIAQVLAQAAPDIDHPSSGDLWGLLKAGRSIRKLGKKDMYRLLRWGPMAAADLVAEYFETELLRAMLAARGIFGSFLGPWSAGSSLVMLLKSAAEPHPGGSSHFAAGGVGAITQAMAAAAQQAGAEIRTNAEVREIIVKEGAASGVVLASGEEIAARAVISNADPKRTLLGLLDPSYLSPDFAMKLKNFRMMGTVAKVNLALSSLPKFIGLSGSSVLSGRLHVGPEIDYLERAFDQSKYGEFSQHPVLEVAIPTVSDPALAPPGKHVMSIYMQFAPYKLKHGTWHTQRTELGETVVKTLAQYAPDLPQLIEHHEVITPKDLEDVYGLTGGHILHGELSLDQFFTMRPLLGWARYATPIQNLYLCGSGTHPGTGLTGGSGANAAKEIVKQWKADRR